MSAAPSEMTVDQLAGEVGMTVRNVRAYASRGLIPAPRLVGRTGYYGQEHVDRLRLIRDLLDRGYTLNAVEKALAGAPHVADVHALDLLASLANPLGQPEEPEEISVAGLARLAGVSSDEDFLARLEAGGLVRRLDRDTLRLLRPGLVRAGAQAMALGLDRDSVLDLADEISAALATVVHRFVDEFREQIWHPFAEAGMPEQDWPDMLARIEAILPVAAQATVTIFRDQLSVAIDDALGEELGRLSGGE